MKKKKMKSQVAQVVVAKAMQKLSPEKHNGVARPTQCGQPSQLCVVFII